jgi:hypothetical protein
MALPKPPAKELAAIAARAEAKTGKAPTQAAVLKTYANNQARTAALKPVPPKPPVNTALDKTAIADRGRAKTGKAPTQAAVDATYERNVARIKARPPKPPASAPTGAATGRLGPGMQGFGDMVSHPGAGGPQDTEGANAYWMDFLARLKAGETPAAIEESNVQRYGGTFWRGQGPEQNLSNKAYSAQVLQQYAGSPLLDNIDVSKTYSPKAFLAYLKKVGAAGYEGMGSGQRNDEEYARMLESAGNSAGLKAGRYGFGYDDNGRRLTIPELIAAAGAAA